MNRTCTHRTCSEQAVATLTYDNDSQMAFLGPLSTTYKAYSYDLCKKHSDSCSPPKGWQIMRLNKVEEN